MNVQAAALFVATMTLAVVLTHGEGIYTIIAPSYFNVDSKYFMSFATEGLRWSMDVNVTFNWNITQLVKVKPNDVTVVGFDTQIFPTDRDEFMLSVVGEGGISFNQYTFIRRNKKPKRYTVFIHFDKNIYRPNEKVQFLILLLDNDYKPLDLTGIQIFVGLEDPYRRTIKQWANVNFTKGVFKSDYQLPIAPLNGFWKLWLRTSKSEDKIFCPPEKTFCRPKNKNANKDDDYFNYFQVKDVRDRMLPKFEIIPNFPVINTYVGNKVIFALEAKYMYGKTVKGTATVMSKNVTDITSNIKIDGKAIVEFDLDSFGPYNRTEDQLNLIFLCEVKEDSTGVSSQKTIKVPVYIRDYTIRIQTSFAKFRPGLPFDIKINVIRRDGVPIIDAVNPVIVSVDFYTGHKTNYTFKLNELGVANLRVTAPKFAETLEVSAAYQDHVESVIVGVEESESNIHMQTRVLSKKVGILKNIRVQVQVTSPIQHLVYYVIGNNGVLAAKRINVNNKKIVTFKFWATQSMAPKANLAIYCYPGSIVSDVIELQFDNLDNYVNIKLSKGEVEPGQEIGITVSAKCNSYIGLHGIDKSASIQRLSYNFPYKQSVHRMRLLNLAIFGRYPEHKMHSPEYLPSYSRLTGSGGTFFTNAKSFNLYPMHEFYGTEKKITTMRWPGDRGPPHAPRPNRFKPSAPRLIGNNQQDTPQNILAGHGGSGGPNLPPPPGDNENCQTDPHNVDNDFELGVRNNLPLTWLWENFDNNGCGTLNITRKVPDTITSWLITGFSINNKNGLGLVESPVALNVLKPFFVSVNLPYKMRLGETFSLPIQVSNYLAEDQEVTVEMSNHSEQFEFVDDENEDDNTIRVRTVTVQANSVASVFMKIVPVMAGNLPVRIKAHCAIAGDTIEHLLRVEPEGVPVYVNKAVLLDLRAKNSSVVDFTIETPTEAVPKSTQVSVAVFGNLYAKIGSLEHFISEPREYDSDNMEAFKVNLCILKFHKAVGKLTPALEARLLKNMENGYKHQLSLQSTASYIGSGNNIMATTTSALRCLAEASAFIKINETVLERVKNWMLSNSGYTWDFETIHFRFFEQSNPVFLNVQLSARAILALLSRPKWAEENKGIIKAACNYFQKLVEAGRTNYYEMADIAYVMQKTGHPFTTKVLKKLEQRKQSEDEYEDFWRRPQYYNEANAAINLAIYVEGGRISDAFAVLNRLIQHQPRFLYDAEPAILEALALMAEKLYVKKVNIDAEITYGTQDKYNLKVDNSNMDTVQNYALPFDTESIRFDCTGTGLAIAQISYKYHTLVSEPFVVDGTTNSNSINPSIVPKPKPMFKLDVTIKDSSSIDNLYLNICTSLISNYYIKESENVKMLIELPSGYVLTPNLVQQMLKQRAPRIENANTLLMLTFATIDSNTVCVDVEAAKSMNITNLKLAFVRVYNENFKDLATSRFYDYGSYLQTQAEAEAEAATEATDDHTDEGL